MRAWLLKDFGGLGSLEWSENVAAPSAGPGQVLVRVEYAALNPADRYLAEKLYPARPTFPHVLGRDGVGVIEAVGAGVAVGQAIGPGRRVCLLRGEAGVSQWGTLAEYVAVPADMVVPAPEDWSLEQSAGAALVYLTAHQALTQWGPPSRDAVVLITGASGGVGVASVHLASGWGMRPVVLSRSEGKRAALLEQGAALALDPADPDLRKRVAEFAGKDGVRIIVDNVAGAGLATALDTLGQGGAASLVGALAGPVPSFNTARLFFRRLRLGGVAAGTFTTSEARAAWDEIVGLLNHTRRRPLVDSVHDAPNLMAAFDALGHGPLGKVVVRW